MPAIKPSCVRDLKMRVSVVDVVSRVATLRRAGSRFKGLCPFHNEKTPSFHVDPDKGFYKCFGCGKAGDIITFVRETEQLGFTEAVEAIGQRFNVTIEYEEGSGGPTREERSLRQEIFEIHEIAADHFHNVFRQSGPTGDFMREYWVKDRKFAPELADEFKIGAADPADSTLGAALLKRRFSEDALRQCGLFFIREGAIPSLGNLRPRFRGRLMIPIRDHQGRIVAFTARQTKLTPEDDPAHEAKYVNSPETPIFTKGNLLFNLDRARTQAGEGHPFVLVEGQLDALRCWSVGLKTAIAPQGTSITESQLHLLRRYHTQVECLFDGDSAGQKAALRFLPMALKAGLEGTFLGVASETKVDPDLLFMERGLAAYDDLRANALSAMAFACRAVLPDPGTASAEARARAAERIFDLIANSESEVARSALLDEARGHLRITTNKLDQDFERHIRRRGHPSHPPAGQDAPAAATGTRDVTPEQHLLLLCLHHEELGKPLAQMLPAEWIDTGHLHGVLLDRFLNEFQHDSWPGHAHLDGLLENQEERTLAASLLFENPEIDDPVKVANEGMRQIRDRFLLPKLRQIELALAEAGQNSKLDPISLIKERIEIQRQLRMPFALPAAD